MTPKNTKLISLEEAYHWRLRLADQNRQLVVTNGCFDLLHHGHVQYLNEARDLGDALLIALNSDCSVRATKGPRRPIFAENERAYVLASLECVDRIVIFHDRSPITLLDRLSPDIYTKGGDYTADTVVQEEYRLLQQKGCRIEFLHHSSGVSTTSIIRKLQDERSD